MRASEQDSNSLVHFVGLWPESDTAKMLAFIQGVEPVLMSGTRVIPPVKPWTMICHESFDPVIYLASRVGVPGVFRAHTPDDLIGVIQCFTDEI
jgi:hypothetical protein